MSDLFECDNCGKRYKSADDLQRQFPDIPDLCARLDVGGTVPAGECNKCGAFVYPVKKKLKGKGWSKAYDAALTAAEELNEALTVTGIDKVPPPALAAVASAASGLVQLLKAAEGRT
jgi:hypothetical protein